MASLQFLLINSNLNFAIRKASSGLWEEWVTYGDPPCSAWYCRLWRLNVNPLLTAPESWIILKFCMLPMHILFLRSGTSHSRIISRMTNEGSKTSVFSTAVKSNLPEPEDAKDTYTSSLLSLRQEKRPLFKPGEQRVIILNRFPVKECLTSEKKPPIFTQYLSRHTWPLD